MDELIERLEAAHAGMHAAAATGSETLQLEAINRLLAANKEAAAELRRVREAPVAIMDTREFLSLCAPTEDDFPALYALQGQRVRLVPERGEAARG